MSTPKFLKDAAGFCYTYTAELAKQKHLTPHDGDVDAKGFAKAAAPAPKAKTKDAE